MIRHASIAFGIICLIASLFLGLRCYDRAFSGDDENETEIGQDPIAAGSVIRTNDDSETEAGDEPFSMSVLNGMVFQCIDGGIVSNLQFCSGDMFAMDYTEEHFDDSSNLYPNGSLSYMEYTGSYDNYTELNDYSASISVSSMELRYKDGTSSISDGILYEYSDAGLISKNDELILYLPNAPASILPSAILDIAGDIPSNRYILYDAESGTIWTAS